MCKDEYLDSVVRPDSALLTAFSLSSARILVIPFTT